MPGLAPREEARQPEAEGQEPEQWRWTDDGGSTVTLDLQRGKLVRWTLVRPEPTGDGEGQTARAAPDSEISDRLTSR